MSRPRHPRVSGRAAMCFQAGALLSPPSGWPCPSPGPPAGLSGPQTPPGAPPRPGRSPGVGVLVVTAVVQQLHRGLWGKQRVGKSGGQAAGRGRCLHPPGLRGLTLEVLARSCCSSRGDVTVGMRHSGDRFSLFCWRRSGRWLRTQAKATHSPTGKPSKAACCLWGKS